MSAQVPTGLAAQLAEQQRQREHEARKRAAAQEAEARYKTATD